MDLTDLDGKTIMVTKNQEENKPQIGDTVKGKTVKFLPSGKRNHATTVKELEC